MVLRVCQSCHYHELLVEEAGSMSHCMKENCWSQYSKCVSHRALDYFLSHQHVDAPDPASSEAHAYIQENLAN